MKEPGMLAKKYGETVGHLADPEAVQVAKRDRLRGAPDVGHVGARR